MIKVHILDTGAGNILSVINALKKLGFSANFVTKSSDFDDASYLIFPGVGAFGPAMKKLVATGLVDPLRRYINSGKPFMGICVGMQALLHSSDESPGVAGLGIIPASCSKFNVARKAVPHMGWNSASSIECSNETKLINHDGPDSKYYFVHSYGILYNENTSKELLPWIHTLTTYRDETFISSVRYKNIFATQFHPEKSGYAGLKILDSFLRSASPMSFSPTKTIMPLAPACAFVNRIIACLDVRTNEHGDLIVTKGDKYDVESAPGSIRNMGKPVQLAEKYFKDGADEITFLNITSFASMPLDDLPMLQVLRLTSENVFVPLTIGGGIRAMTTSDGTIVSALDVAQEYFRSGADKVSIGSDAVYATEKYLADGAADGSSCIEQISAIYGAQAVVISVDPRRVYVHEPIPSHTCIETTIPGPDGEMFCWYECTVKGGREARNIDVVQLLNCMDKDGSNSGYDLELLALVKKHVEIPVIASSGAGTPGHFEDALRSGADATLAAGIFHREEVPISDVKLYLKSRGFIIRNIY